MAKSLDLKGQRFGKLTVIERAENTKRGTTTWLCKCDCGNSNVVRASNLKSGAVKSCGCMSHQPRRRDLTGERFGKLTVLKYIDGKGDCINWECKCDCGNTIIVKGKNLLRGHRLSCGCLKGMKDNDSKYNIRNRIRKSLKKESYNRLRNCWLSMKRRCTPKYHDRKDYYDRGINVCEEWMDFYSFAQWSMDNGYKDTLTLDRLDNNKGYEPSNCRWTNMKVQQNNKRNNVYITYMGKTQTMSQWCDELNLNYGMVRERRKRGWDVPRLFEEKHKNQYA